MDWAIATKMFAALFAIMNPLSCIPIFLALTADETPAERRTAVVGMIATIAIGFLICALVGQRILDIFGIAVPHFELAGGLIVLLIALNMLNGNESTAHAGTAAEKQTYSAASNPGIYPLGIPISFGPGTMSAIIVIGQSANGWDGQVGYFAGLIGYVVFFSILLIMAPLLTRWLSPSALSISKRIMGMILAAIAAEMMSNAIGKLFPALMKV